MGWVKDSLEIMCEFFSSPEVKKLREENGRLRKELANREGVVFRENVYWREKAGEPLEGPFCPHCWGEKDKLINLGERDGYRSCAACKWGQRFAPTSASVNPPRMRKGPNSWMAY